MIRPAAAARLHADSDMQRFEHLNLWVSHGSVSLRYPVFGGCRRKPSVKPPFWGSPQNVLFSRVTFKGYLPLQQLLCPGDTKEIKDDMSNSIRLPAIPLDF